MAKAVGVDGCKAGWFYTVLDGDEFQHGIARSIVELATMFSPEDSVFIDIPIGLVDDDASGRRCDREARKAIGERRSSVFSAPCWDVLSATSYPQANEFSEKAIGKKISQQAYAIVPKIREVNLYLLGDGVCPVIREVHPEVCFWALNGNKAMSYPKKKPEGYAERIHLLKKRLPHVEDWAEEMLATYKRKDVARDDIPDALVSMLTAQADPNLLKTLPAFPDKDSRGLPMEMVYIDSP